MIYLTKDLEQRKNMTIMVIGSMLGIGIVTFLSSEFGMPILIASFGATAVLIYGAPKSPFAKPRNVFFGHLISAIIGVSCFAVMGCEWYSMTVAVTAAIAAMTVTGTVHPPGGATALVCVESMASPTFVLFPVMIGVSLLLVVALIMNKVLEIWIEKDGSEHVLEND